MLVAAAPLNLTVKDTICSADGGADQGDQLNVSTGDVKDPVMYTGGNHSANLDVNLFHVTLYIDKYDYTVNYMTKCMS